MGKKKREEWKEGKGRERRAYQCLCTCGYMTCCCYLGNGEDHVTAERGHIYIEVLAHSGEARHNKTYCIVSAL